MLEDHDLTAEAAMLAFGGKPASCLGVLKRWRDMHTWAMSGELFQAMQSRLDPEALLPGDLRAAHELGLMLTWERGWRRSAYLGGYERLLHEQLRKRALAPLREHLAFWRRRSGARLVSSAEVKVQRPGRSPSVQGSMDKVRVSATATVGVAWTHRVWARDLALVEGAFVLDAEEVEGQTGGPDGLRVQAVRWQERAAGTWAPVATGAWVRTGDEGALGLVWHDG